MSKHNISRRELLVKGGLGAAWLALAQSPVWAWAFQGSEHEAIIPLLGLWCSGSSAPDSYLMAAPACTQVVPTLARACPQIVPGLQRDQARGRSGPRP